MDEVIKIIGIGLISLIITIIIKQYKPEFAIYISIVAGVLILFLIMDKLEGIINLLKTISSKSGINNQFLELLLKITGIAFLTEFAINLCKDSGENAIRDRKQSDNSFYVNSYNFKFARSYFEIIISSRSYKNEVKCEKNFITYFNFICFSKFSFIKSKC